MFSEAKASVRAFYFLEGRVKLKMSQCDHISVSLDISKPKLKVASTFSLRRGAPQESQERGVGGERQPSPTNSGSGFATLPAQQIPSPCPILSDRLGPSPIPIWGGDNYGMLSTVRPPC